jgi:outer membrane protein insertion porin family
VTRAFLAAFAGVVLIGAPFLCLGQAPAPPKNAAPPAAGPKIDPKLPPPQIAKYPLESLKIKGNRMIPAEKIIAVSGLKIGVEVEKSDFDVARDRLIATGAFENAGYEYAPNASGSGYDGVIEVVEAPQFFAYRLDDLPASEETLRAALRKAEPIFGDRIPPSTAVLNRFTRDLNAALGGNIEVKASLIPENGDTIILFRPAGSVNNVAEVRFAGNEVLPASVLVKALSAVAIGVPYTERTFRQMLDASIRPLYDARGRIRVEFPNITTGRAKNSEGLIVTTAIREGPVYNLGKIRLMGVSANQIADLEKAANWKKEDIANFDDIQSGADRIRNRLKQNGYLDARTRVERDIRDADHTVDVAVTVEPGPQYRMGKLTINGLDILSEPVIRKMWQLQEGRPFPFDYPDNFLARVRGEGVFDNLGKTRADTQIDDNSHVVDVTLFFSGAGPQDKESQRRVP